MRINNVKTEINLTITNEELVALAEYFEKTEKCTPYRLLKVLNPMIISLKGLNNDFIRELKEE